MKSFFSLVGRNGQGVGTSVFSEWVKRAISFNLSKEDKEKLDNFIEVTYKEMDNGRGAIIFRITLLNNKLFFMYYRFRISSTFFFFFWLDNYNGMA